MPTVEKATFKHVEDILGIAESHAVNVREEPQLNAEGFLVSGFDRAGYHYYLDHAEHFYVALIDGHVAGFLLGYSSSALPRSDWMGAQIQERDTERFVLIKQVAVDRGHARKGVASALYKHLFGAVLGCRLYTAIVVYPRNEASIAFHEKMGFKKVFEATPPDDLRRGVWTKKGQHLNSEGEVEDG